MSRRFMRYVRSLSEVRKSGTDSNFYMGPEFVVLPQEIAKSLRLWCGENASSVTLGMEGPDDDPIEVYVVNMSNASDLDSLKNILSIELTDCISSASSKIPENVFSREGDRSFDSMRASCEVRDFLVRVEGDYEASRRAKTAKDPAIVIQP